MKKDKTIDDVVKSNQWIDKKSDRIIASILMLCIRDKKHCFINELKKDYVFYLYYFRHHITFTLLKKDKDYAYEVEVIYISTENPISYNQCAFGSCNDYERSVVKEMISLLDKVIEYIKNDEEIKSIAS